jgi:hypothetical protein
MSALKTSNIKNLDGSLSVPTETVIAGSAKAWVNFNGTGTVAIRDSFNVSSITDNGTGNYRVNFIEPMPSANMSCGFSGDGTSRFNEVATANPAFVNIVTVNNMGAATDLSTVCVQVFANA